MSKTEPIVVNGRTAEDWKGVDLWVSPDGVAYSAYPASVFRRKNEAHYSYKKYEFNTPELQAEYEQLCIQNGHSSWADYHHGVDCTTLEHKGWAHVTGSGYGECSGRICVRASRLTRKQKDTLCIWGLFNGYKGSEDAWTRAVDDLDNNEYCVDEFNKLDEREAMAVVA